MESYKYKVIQKSLDSYSSSRQNPNFMEIRDLGQIKLSKLHLIKVEANWRDQNYGNKKAALGLSLMRDGEEIAFKDIFGTYEREEGQQTQTVIDSNEEIVQLFQKNDSFLLKGRVGGGGGHELIIDSLEIYFQKQKKVKVESSSSSSSSSDNEQ